MNKKVTEINDVVLIVQIVQVVGRLGLSMAGAMCGTFVAALLTMTNAAVFDSAWFIPLMVLVGILGFYLGIDVTHLCGSLASHHFDRPRIDPIELLSKIGTFLAAIAALISVCAFVFDEAPRRSFEYIVASWWMVGVVLQIGAGLIGRIHLAKASDSTLRSPGEMRALGRSPEHQRLGQ
jgi:hypothetical protein